LMGKITNSSDKDISDLAKSKKVMDLVTVLGLKLSSKSIDNLQYGKIVLFTDQDHDGDAISCLLINLIWKCWPDLIKESKLYKAQSPLINAINLDTKKKKKFFSHEELDNEIGNWKILEYNKGLGSLSEEDYKFSLTNLVKITIDDESNEALEIAFGVSADRRKEWIMK
jgi:DNA topoisomerase II